MCDTKTCLAGTRHGKPAAGKAVRRPSYTENRADGAIGHDIRNLLKANKLLEDEIRRLNAQMGVFKALSENTEEVFFQTDLSLQVTYINKAANQLFGLPVNAVISRPLADKFTKQSIDIIKRHAAHAMILERDPSAPPNRSRDMEVEYIKPDGSHIWLHLHVMVARDSAGTVIGFQGSARDITASRAVGTALDRERELLRSTMQSVADGVIATDRNAMVQIINRKAELITGWKAIEAIGKPIAEVLVFRQDEDGSREMPWMQVLSELGSVESFQHSTLHAKNRDKIPVDYTVSSVVDSEGMVAGAVVAFRDVSEHRRRQEKIRHMSLHDQLTGLGNRRSFDLETNRIEKHDIAPCSLTLLDVNGLKLTNDAYGHAVGDSMLVQTAEALRTVWHDDAVIARIGGDEFAILSDLTDMDQLDYCMLQVNNRLAQASGTAIELSVSHGSAIRFSDELPMGILFKQAEDLMYRRKLTESDQIKRKTVEKIISTLQERHPSQRRHAIRVSMICGLFAEALHMTLVEINDLKLAGMLHDIGKIVVPEEILNKIPPMTDQDMALIRRHPEAGYRILSSVNEYGRFASQVLDHHERWDGTGYPRGLRKNDIQLSARIISIADAWDAMTTNRPYRSALPHQDAVGELMLHAGRQFDPALVGIFIRDVLPHIPG